jgi:hypothetical protein
MTLYDFLAYGQPYSCARVFPSAMQALEDNKNAIEVLRVYPNTIVAY